MLIKPPLPAEATAGEQGEWGKLVLFFFLFGVQWS